MIWSGSLRVMARVWSRSFDLAAVEVTVRTWRVASLDSTPLSTAAPITPCRTLLAFFAEAEPRASATRWKARVYVRGHDGLRQEIVRFGRTRREAEASLDTAVAPSFAEPMPSSTQPCRYSMRVSTG